MEANFSVLYSDILSLAVELGIPEPVCDRLAVLVTPDFPVVYETAVKDLVRPDSAEKAWQSLKKEFSGIDPDGMRMLAVFLGAAVFVGREWEAAEVSRRVFLDTMGCLTRFIREDYERTGNYCFTRDFWAWRQISGQLFRLGTLEFEYRRLGAEEAVPGGFVPGTPVISVHIPSDAQLTASALADSYEECKRFFSEEGVGFLYAGKTQAVLCSSWLLSPGLQGLLSPESGIARFAREYCIYAEEPEEDSFYFWLFEGKTTEPLPQNTSLQRKVSEYIRNGGRIGSASGRYMGFGIKETDYGGGI